MTIATLLAGLALFLVSNGRWIVPVAAWLAPVFLLRWLRGRNAAGVLLLLALFFAATRVMLYGIIPEFLGALTWVLAFVYSLLWFLPYLADRLLARRISGFAATLVFPAAAVSVEYLAGLGYGTWGAVAYSQYGHLPLLQLLSVTGLWGVTFLVMWCGPVVNAAWDRRSAGEAIGRGPVVYAGIVIAVVLLGAARLALHAPAGVTVRVASFTDVAARGRYLRDLEEAGCTTLPGFARMDRDRARAAGDRLYGSLFDRTRELAGGGAALVLWPETAVAVMEDDEYGFLARGGRTAWESSIYLLASYYLMPLDWPAEPARNKSVLLDPKGRVVWEYLKTHPVPGSTDVRGDGVVPTADTPFGRIGSVICYDMDFPGLAARAGRAGVDIMLVPSWDWEAIDPLHTRMATFRAIENGYALVRHAADGLSVAVDPYGRILASMDHFTTDDPVLIAEVPTAGVRTLYAMVGDGFAWLCLAGLALAVGRAVRGRR